MQIVVWMVTISICSYGHGLVLLLIVSDMNTYLVRHIRQVFMYDSVLIFVGVCECSENVITVNNVLRLS